MVSELESILERVHKLVKKTVKRNVSLFAKSQERNPSFFGNLVSITLDKKIKLPLPEHNLLVSLGRKPFSNSYILGKFSIPRGCDISFWRNFSNHRANLLNCRDSSIVRSSNFLSRLTDVVSDICYGVNCFRQGTFRHGVLDIISFGLSESLSINKILAAKFLTGLDKLRCKGSLILSHRPSDNIYRSGSFNTLCTGSISAQSFSHGPGNCRGS